MLTVTSLNGFSQPVSLLVSGVPEECSSSLSHVKVSPPPNDSVGSVLTVTLSLAASTGTSTLTVRGTWETLVHTTTVRLTVK